MAMAMELQLVRCQRTGVGGAGVGKREKDEEGKAIGFHCHRKEESLGAVLGLDCYAALTVMLCCCWLQWCSCGYFSCCRCCWLLDNVSLTRFVVVTASAAATSFASLMRFEPPKRRNSKTQLFCAKCGNFTRCVAGAVHLEACPMRRIRVIASLRPISICIAALYRFWFLCQLILLMS